MDRQLEGVNRRARLVQPGLAVMDAVSPADNLEGGGERRESALGPDSGQLLDQVADGRERAAHGVLAEGGRSGRVAALASLVADIANARIDVAKRPGVVEPRVRRGGDFARCLSGVRRPGRGTIESRARRSAQAPARAGKPGFWFASRTRRRLPGSSKRGQERRPSLACRVAKKSPEKGLDFINCTDHFGNVNLCPANQPLICGLIMCRFMDINSSAGRVFQQS